MANENNKPVKKFKAGAVSAALWKNVTALKTGNEIETMSLTLDRRYKDRDGIWKNSSSLRLNDLPKAMLVLSKAYEYLVTKSDESAGIATGEETA